MAYKQYQFDQELAKMLGEAAENGVTCTAIVSKDLHDRVVQSNDNRMPMACNAMWKLWVSQGKHQSRIIHTTPSNRSSTIKIEFDTEGYLRANESIQDDAANISITEITKPMNANQKTDDTLLEVKNISLSFGGVKVLSDISFDIKRGEIRAIIGPNGAGKSSMLNIINGFYHPQQGEIWFNGRKRGTEKPFKIARQGIARTFQNIALFKGMSTLDNLMTGRITKMNTNIFWHALWKGPAEREEIQHRERVEHIIDFLKIQAIRKTPVGRLPYGLQKRVELGRALVAESKLLLLDEPMAGMNLEEKQDMCRFILDANTEFDTTIALIEHDMGVVMDLSDRVVVLNYGRKIGDDTPDEVRNNQAVIDAYLGLVHDA